ncbi:MAG: hypothetical protein C0429_09615 [Sphingopyxis sp.]|nr:hypothetical protein [Sphingopyxis sp.]
MDTEAPKQRKKRYSNNLRNPVKVAARATTLDVLQVIYEQEYIRSTQIDMLIPRSRDGIRRTLQLLHRAGLVCKPEDKPEDLDVQVNNYAPDVYFISDAGERFLFDYREPDLYVNTYRPRGNVNIEYKHKLGIAETIANIRAGALQSPCRFISQGELEREAKREENQPIKFPATVACEIDGRARSWTGELSPDGFFAIEYPDGARSHIALEYQRKGKIDPKKLLGVSSMRKKMLGYVHIQENRAYAPFSMRYMRVLFVFSKVSAFNESVNLAQELFPEGNPMFLFVHQPEYRQTEHGYLNAPHPNPALFTTPLYRTGLPAVPLYNPEKDLS